MQPEQKRKYLLVQLKIHNNNSAIKSYAQLFYCIMHISYSVFCIIPMAFKGTHSQYTPQKWHPKLLILYNNIKIVQSYAQLWHNKRTLNIQNSYMLCT